MIFRRKLVCSFCRRSEAEVAKLVAGPRVYICDRCAHEVIRIMNESDQAPSPAPRGPHVSRLRAFVV
jgi:ATP-dependent Clp protease ATP-binding subunit ClpX